MEFRVNPSDDSVKKIEIIDKSQVGGNAIETRTPIIMYDAIGSIIAIYNPQDSLKTKDEITMSAFSSLKAYTPENEAILWNLIHQTGLDEFAKFQLKELTDMGYPPKRIFFVMVDMVTEAFCAKIGDSKQDLRVDVLSKMYKLADPKIFDKINNYSQLTFNSDISQLILTQDDPIMRRVYEIMLANYGVDVITIPDKRFEGLNKDNPELYAKVVQHLNSSPNNVGFYDDSTVNIKAASDVGILTKLATGIKNNDPSIIEVEAKGLVEQLFGEQSSYGKVR